MTRSNYVAVDRIATFLSTDELEPVVRALEALGRGVKSLEATNGDDAAVLDADYP